VLEQRFGLRPCLFKALALGDVDENAMGARLPVWSVMDAAVDQDSERLCRPSAGSGTSVR
jgi:hypothetical protein